MSSSVYINNKKNILTLGEGPIEGLDDATLIAEARYFISFIQLNRIFCSSFYYNGSNSFLFVNATKCISSKQKITK